MPDPLDQHSFPQRVSGPLLTLLWIKSTIRRRGCPPFQISPICSSAHLLNRTKEVLEGKEGAGQKEELLNTENGIKCRVSVPDVFGRSNVRQHQL